MTKHHPRDDHFQSRIAAIEGRPERELDPEQLNEFCKNPPCALSTCRRPRTCVYE